MEAHFNKLTPAEAERLALLLEECGEVIQVIGKIQRHGYQSKNPLESTDVTNREMLEGELGHVIFAINTLIGSRDVRSTWLANSTAAKEKSIVKWLHHQRLPIPPEEPQ